MRLRAFFKFFGAKHQAAEHYPSPVCETIIEPFAGSAAYATLHPSKRVVLIDRDPRIVEVWRYLISAKSSEIRRLPVFKGKQERIEDLGPLCQEAKTLIGFWLFTGSTYPRDRRSSWAKNPEYADRFWGEQIRERLASQADQIRHWKITEGGYESAPSIRATWFVDPPYQIAGKCYRHSSKDIDYGALAAWCRARRGQTIVCENEGASWLPFVFLKVSAANAAKPGRQSREAVCLMSNEMAVTVPTSATGGVGSLRDRIQKTRARQEELKTELAAVDVELAALEAERQEQLAILGELAPVGALLVPRRTWSRRKKAV